MHRLLLLLILFPLLAGPVPAAGEDGYEKILDRFRKRIESPDLDRRLAGFRLLDPNRAETLPEMRKLLSSVHWLMRGAAAEVLSRVTDAPLRAELRLDLLTHKDPLVREGIALAFALSPVKGDAEALSGALGDGVFEVRRTAAIALSGIVSRDSLEALIAAIRKETDARVAVLLGDTLRKLTGRNYGRNAKAWRAWWERNKDRPEIKGLTEEVKRREFGGVPLETVTVATRPSASKKLDFLVLAPFGWTHDVYRPWLDEMTAFARVTYVKLPSVRRLTGLSGYGPAIPTYPVGRLVRALEGLRKELGRNRVVVLGDGATGWIAQRYAIAYPTHTVAVIVIDGFVDAASYAAALARFARSPAPAERWAAETLRRNNDVPLDRAAFERISRITLTASLADPRDSLAYLRWIRDRDPQGFVTVPPVRLGKRSTFPIPSLFYFGARNRLSGLPEAERIREHFPRNIIAPMRKSGGFCYVTEYVKFYEVLRGFLGYYGLWKP